ncbi:MAG: hypothetical protein LBF88_02965 [Planctomycetaceae bacterium]|jgi:chromosome segregation ATPase|nr:hypothetical protein [Planctomycetaceae bacterium]
MKTAPIFRFFFTPLEWIFLLFLVLGVCGYFAYPLAIKYVAEKVCLDLYEELITTKNKLFETQNELENITNELLETKNEFENIKNKLSATQTEFETIKDKLTETQNELDKTEEKLNAAQKKMEELEKIIAILPDQSKIATLQNELEKTQNDLSKYQNQVYDWQDYCRKMLKYLDTINVPIDTRPSIPKYFQIELDRSK